jgi:hypothetical protein
VRIARKDRPAHDGTVWETVDPDGRRVVLTFSRWRHIVERHSELAQARDEILAAVASPGVRRPGHEPGEEWFYGAGVGPTHWVRVVVHFEGAIGSITTAFPRRALP